MEASVSTKKHHTYQDIRVREFPGVTIILSECVEHGEIGGDEKTPGCGREMTNYRTRVKPVSDIRL